MASSIATSSKNWLVLLVCCAASQLHAQTCLTLTPRNETTAPPQIVQDGAGTLTIKLMGPADVAGDVTGYSISATGGETVLSRTIPKSASVSVQRLGNNGVKVCTSQTETATAEGKGASGSLPSAPQVKPESNASKTDKLNPQGDTGKSEQSSDQKKSCLETAANCDIEKTLSDIAPPDSPAFTVLGISPKDVNRPTSPADFATSLLNGFDARGNFQSGAALDSSPFLVFGSQVRFLAHYGDDDRKYWWVRPLARTTVSYATTKGASDADKALRLAVGLRIVVFDQGDPRLLFAKCVQEFVPDPNRDIGEQRRELKQKRDDCVRRSAKRIWNASSLIIAGAPTWISKTGSASDFTTNGGGYWSSLGLRLSDWGQIVGTFRRRTGEQVPDQTSGQSSSFVNQDSTVAGGAFRFGKGTFNGSLEGLYIHTNKASKLESHPEFGFGIEKKLTANLFVESHTVM
jgi:hypothetical protein